MIVQSLGHQLQSQWIFVASGLFDFGTFVLEPDFDLGLVQSQLTAELLASPFSKVSVFGKLVLWVKTSNWSILVNKRVQLKSGRGQYTFNRANWGPLNAVRGRFSSDELPFSLGGFFGRLVRGPVI